MLITLSCLRDRLHSLMVRMSEHAKIEFVSWNPGLVMSKALGNVDSYLGLHCLGGISRSVELAISFRTACRTVAHIWVEHFWDIFSFGIRINMFQECWGDKLGSTLSCTFFGTVRTLWVLNIIWNRNYVVLMVGWSYCVVVSLAELFLVTHLWWIQIHKAV